MKVNLDDAPRTPSLLDLAASARAGATAPVARIARVAGRGPSEDRLRELGFTKGTEVRFVRAAPLGDPLCFRLRGTEICLRRAEAARIEIEAP